MNSKVCWATGWSAGIHVPPGGFDSSNAVLLMGANLVPFRGKKREKRKERCYWCVFTSHSRGRRQLKVGIGIYHFRIAQFALARWYGGRGRSSTIPRPSANQNSIQAKNGENKDIDDINWYFFPVIGGVVDITNCESVLISRSRLVIMRATLLGNSKFIPSHHV